MKLESSVTETGVLELFFVLPTAGAGSWNSMCEKDPQLHGDNSRCRF